MRKIDLTNIQTASSETARDINRRVLLNLVRQHQPISRADLARYSGLQRSTVSVITEQLIAERWLREGAIGHLPRGRKPTFLHLNVERARVIGLSIRPVLSELALADLSGRFISHQMIPSGENPKEFISQVVKQIRSLIKAHPQIEYEGIGISVPGRIDPSNHRLIFAPNLKWGEVDLKTPLEKATGLTVEIENAASACALTELWFDSRSEGARNFATVTVSEGIGVGLVMNGERVRGNSGLAGEFGHMTLQADGPICNCGNQGCWEVFAANNAAIRFYLQKASNVRNGSRARPVTAPSFEDLLQLADQGDGKALEAMQRMAGYLGQGLAQLILAVAPDVIMIVGEVTNAWSQIEPILWQEIRRHCRVPHNTRIVPSDHRTKPRLRGAIALILQKHFGLP